MRALIVAGTHSGAGKTTLALALIAALRLRGLRVRAFKVGPDFIDAAHLAAASGALCRNLDGWMLGREACRASLARAAAECDIAIVEGMMGLYDGVNGASDAGSTAEMAKWLGLPVVLVTDASGAARSLAATVLGYREFDPEVTLAGVVFNRVGGAGHAEYLRQAMLTLPEVAILGNAWAEPALHLPERHLGLTMPLELPEAVAPNAAAWAAWAEQHLDMEGILQRATPVAGVAGTPLATPPRAGTMPRVRLGVARDAAFCFYYPENLERLRAAGAEVIPFSPLVDAELPPALDGIYFGGGYPEVHAAQLEANLAMRTVVAAFAARGGFIYAECGGLMYLARQLHDVAGRAFAMCGVLPVEVEMLPRLAAIGYRDVTPTGLGLAAGARARGHEFHHSRMRAGGAGDTAAAPYLAQGGVVASYIHLHFASCPELAAAMVAAMTRKLPAQAWQAAPA